ncbi:MBL fold metallo-hydrolase [candidate division KSB1 bacterium]|nr:MBL fold metallo-hydrolase [candidate division KSB1 bacterium]
MRNLSLLYLLIFSTLATGQIVQPDCFVFEKLTDGVYAAIARPDGGSVSNAGIVDLGGQVLIFDTGLSQAGTRELIAAAKELTGHDIAFVANSHYHKDHTWGNQLFGQGTIIISSEYTRRAILENRPKDDATELAALVQQRLAKLDSSLRMETDKKAREETLWNIGYYRGLAASYPDLRIVAPTMTFSHELILNGETRTARLLFYGHASTPGDIFLYLPEDKILFTGDIVMNGMHPFLSESSPQNWLKIIKKMQQLPVDRVLPGHGPLCDDGCLTRMADYLQGLLQSAQRCLDENRSVEELKSQGVPPPFDGWYYNAIYESSFKFVHQVLQASGGSN